jgi:hypothetical protein
MSRDDRAGAAGSGLPAPLVIDWFDPEPALVAERLLALGLIADATGTIMLGGAVIRLRTAEGPSRLAIETGGAIEAGGAVAAAAPDSARDGIRLLAVGVATVDAERFLAEHLELDASREPDDEHLGAWAWLTRGSAPRIVVLEPSTEGRLVGSLARLGEGPVAIYLGGAATKAGTVAGGPLGPEALLQGGPPSGPHVLLVRTGGTIRP